MQDPEGAGPRVQLRLPAGKPGSQYGPGQGFLAFILFVTEGVTRSETQDAVWVLVVPQFCVKGLQGAAVFPMEGVCGAAPRFPSCAEIADVRSVVVPQVRQAL